MPRAPTTGFAEPDRVDHFPLLSGDLLTSPVCRSCVLRYAGTLTGPRKSSPRVIIAQIARAILLASAVATTRRGFFSSMRASHGSAGVPPLRIAQLTIAMAPQISNRRISRCPIFVVLPNRSLPPLEFCLGTRPSHAAKSRPRLNCSMGGAKLSMAMAVMDLLRQSFDLREVNTSQRTH